MTEPLPTNVSDSIEAIGAISFEPPGAGTWMLDTTHHGRRPLTQAIRPLADEAFVNGMGSVLERYGLPLVGFRTGYVHGCQYVRPVAVGEPENPKGSPPRPVLWAMSRLHPELRRRNRTAATAWAERRWRIDVDEWFEHERPRVVGRNRELQAVELTALDDDQLLAHIDEVAEHCRTTATSSFALHGGDIIPVGDYLAHCEDWGIEPACAAGALAGASPATRAVADVLEPVAQALRATDQAPDTVDAVRQLGPEVAAAVDRWLADHGWRLLFSDDLDSPTLAERPALQLQSLRSSARLQPVTTDPGSVRERVPASEQARFDGLLDEARYGLGLRDDHVGIAWNWCFGLLRRALLEVGRRLVSRDRLDTAEHILELDLGEVGDMLRRGDGPPAAELAGRRTHRLEVEAAGPPDTLGPAAEPPPFGVFPASLARAARAVMAMIGAMEGTAAADPLRGVGVGTVAYRGRARLVNDPDESLLLIEPGDVIVTSVTGPSWNSMLPVVGALVVEEGGPLSHAAIVARELGIPAVIGVSAATTVIPDGSTVDVDPTTGVVHIG